MATDPPARSSEPGARFFVWGVWLGLTLATLGFVARHGPRVPVGDDYAITSLLTGDRPLTLAALWEQHNEHRLPLPRLVLLAVDRLSGYDFRAGMFSTVTLLSALSAGMIIVSSYLRHQTFYSDAFFPLILLNWGHYNNLLWSWQVQFALSTALGGGLLLVIATRGRDPGPSALGVIGLGLALLPLCGANGLAFVPPLAAWLLGLAAVRAWSGGAVGLRRAAMAVLAALPGLALTVLYFVDYERPAAMDKPSSMLHVLRTALQFLALAAGPVAIESWRLFGAIVGLLAALSLAILAALAIARPADRSRMLGIAAAIAGLGVLTLGLAWGRASGGDRAGLEPRYITLIAPLPCASYLVWTCFGSPRLRPFVGMLLFAGSCVLLWPNMTIGLDDARQRKARSEAVIRDIESGVPASLLIRRHSPWLHLHQDALTRCLPMLHRAGIWPFDALHPDPPMRAVPGPRSPSSLRLAEWDSSTRTIQATGVDPWVRFDLPDRRFIYGIRLRYSHHNSTGSAARFRIGWKRDDQPTFPDDQQYGIWSFPTGDHRSTTVWIVEPIDSFRIQPDNRPCTFQIESLTLLVPERATGQASR